MEFLYISFSVSAGLEGCNPIFHWSVQAPDGSSVTKKRRSLRHDLRHLRKSEFSLSALQFQLIFQADMRVQYSWPLNVQGLRMFIFQKVGNLHKITVSRPHMLFSISALPPYLQLCIYECNQLWKLYSAVVFTTEKNSPISGPA